MKKSLKILNTRSQIKKKINRNIRLYEQYINTLKRILFGDNKGSGRGLTISSLPILLSKIYTNNSSK